MKKYQLTRFVSVLLACVMVLGIVPAAAVEDAITDLAAPEISYPRNMAEPGDTPPSLRTTEAIERRVSSNSNVVIYRDDNGYMFTGLSCGDYTLVPDRDYYIYGSETNIESRFISGLGVGVHTITFHYAETDEVLTATVIQTAGDISEVRWRQSFRSSWSSFDKETYTGKPITKKPILYVGSWDNDKRESMLIEGVDYTVSYENNVNVSTDESKAKMILTGIGEYEGSERTLEFTIQPLGITTSSDCYLEVIPNYDAPLVCDGKEKDLLDVTVRANGVTLVKDVDYTAEYDKDHWKDAAKEAVGENGLPVGSPDKTIDYPVIIKGIGNYSGAFLSWSGSYAQEVRYRIMPHVAETVYGEEVEGFTWSLNPDGLLTITGEGDMPTGFSHAYWVGGNDPEHYYKRGWMYDYADMVKRVVITGNVTSIEESAFSGCVNLVDVTLPDTVVTINSGAFSSCRNLQSVHAPGTKYLPQSLRNIYTGAFGSNTYNLSIWLPDNVPIIAAGNIPASRKLCVRAGTVTHETLKALGMSGAHIVEGYEDFILEYADNYGLGGTYTACGYVGRGGEAVLPDFIDSVTVYDVFDAESELITKLTIPGSVKILHGDAFRFMSRCAEVVIEPGEMETLTQGFLSYHGDTVMTIPDTVQNMPDGYFSYFYDSLILIVNEGSAALEWAKENGFIEDDGTGVGKMYRVVKNSQPYVKPSNADVPRGALVDVTFTKSDGEFTFTGVNDGDYALVSGTDYTVSGNVITVKKSYLETAEPGVHTLTLQYSGTSSEGVGAKYPKFRLNIIDRSYPTITVYGYKNEDITDKCTVVFKSGGRVLEEPVNVIAGNTVEYSVTPTDELIIDGVQYYLPYTDSVVCTEAEQKIEVNLGRRGTLTAAVTANGQPVPMNDDAGYTVTWYNENGGNIGCGFTSPMLDEGTKVSFKAKMTGGNIEDYPDAEEAFVTVGFGSGAVTASVVPYTKCTATLTVYGKDGVNITDKCEIVWRKDGRVLPENFLVNMGTNVTYTVTPGDGLMIDGVQYYGGFTGEITLEHTTERAEVTLGRQGNVTVTVTSNGEPLPDNENAGYTVTWYDENGSRIGNGLTSPTRDDGEKLSYTVTMWGENGYDYPNTDKTIVTVGLGNSTSNTDVLPKNNVTLTVSGTKRSGEAVKYGDYQIFWFIKDENGEFQRISLSCREYENGVKLYNMSDYAGKDIYYEIAPNDGRRGEYNWLQIKGVPLSEQAKISVTGKPESFAIELEAVTETVFTGTVTNAAAIGADNIEFSLSQAPWTGYATGRSYYSYGNLWAEQTKQVKVDENGNFSFTVCDFPLTVKITEKTGNFKSAYVSVAADDLETPAAVTLIPEDLPSTLYVKIIRTYPSSRDGGTSSSQLYITDTELENDFTSMTFTLYNKTKGKVVDPSLYTLKYDRIEFADMSALTGIIDTYDELTLSFAFPEDSQAVVTVDSDTVRMTHNFYSFGNDTSFDLAYTEFGRADIRTDTGWRGSDDFAIYDNVGALVVSGSTNRYGYTTKRLDDGEYTVVAWRRINWITAADSIEEMLAYFTGEYAGLYKSADFTVSKGRLSRVELGETPEIKPRPLFTDDSGLADESVNMTAGEWVLMKLHYEVDGVVVETHPDAAYEITVRTNIYAVYDPYVIPRCEANHRYGEASKDKYISLYVGGKLKESAVRIDLQDEYHLGSVHGFTLFTNEPEGDIYYYVRADRGGTFYSDAKGVMRLSDGTIDRSAKLGETKYNVTAAKNPLCFASDYLRTEDNGNGENIVWVYTSPDKNVTLYMDGVAIAEYRSNYSGIARFNFKMSEARVGYAERAEFAAADPAWRVAGGHEMYALSEDGVQSDTAYIECVKASDFKPALLTYLQVTSFTDDESDSLNGRTLPLYEKKSGSAYLYNQYNSVGNSGNVFSYRFTAWFDDGESVDSAYMIIGDQAGRQYLVELTRNKDGRSFSGIVSDERLLFTEWSIVMFSAGRAKLLHNNKLDPDELVYDPLVKDIVTTQTLYERLVDYADSLTEEEAAQIQKEEFDTWKELLYELTAEYYENADDFDWDSLDGSPESIAAIYEFFGYTTGTAADVDYESWEEGDYVSDVTEDGRTFLYREEFTTVLNRYRYTEIMVVLPTEDDPDGFSQTHTVDLGQVPDTQRITLAPGDAADKPTAKPKNFAAGINLSGAANQISRAHQKVTGKGQEINYSKLALQTALSKNSYGTGSNNSTNINQLGLMQGLDKLTLQSFGDEHSDAGDNLVNAYNGLTEAMNQGGYKSIESAINGVLNALENSSEKEGKKINASGLLKTFADSQNGDWYARTDYVFGEYGGEHIGETYGFSSETYENYLKAKALLEALGELQDGLRGFNKNFNLFNTKDINKLINSNGGGANSRPIHDPQGIVYEAVLSNPIEGATVTLYERGEDGGETEWFAEEYGQINPQVTNGSGMYQWFVPEGEWQVRVTAPEGYFDNTSAAHPAANLDDGSTPGWLPVMPVQMGINIPLVRDVAPVVESVMIYETHAEIVFSIYMDTKTLTDKNVTLTDGTNVIPCMIVFPDEEADPMDGDRYYARTMCLSVSGGLDADTEYYVTIDGTATAYNGRTLEAYNSDPQKTFAASVTRSYAIYKETEISSGWREYVYDVRYYHTLNEALDAAAETFNALDTLDNPEDYKDRLRYTPTVITLMKNVTVDEGETVALPDAIIPVILDFNGFTLEIKGTLTGENERAALTVMSGIPGVLISSGTIDVSARIASGDEVYITGGLVTHYFSAFGGTYKISGGLFTDTVYFYNEKTCGGLSAEIKGDAEFTGVFCVRVYTGEDAGIMKLTIKDKVKIKQIEFNISHVSDFEKPCVIIQGGYFTVDPRTITEGYEELNGYIETACEPEEFDNQKYWEADNEVYTWRVLKKYIPGDVNEDGNVNNKDIVALFKYISKIPVDVNETALDITGDNAINNKDVVALFRYVSKVTDQISDKPYFPA